MDELLQSRVEQLRLIEERLDEIAKRLAAGQMITNTIRLLMLEVRDMIAAAEREHAEF